MPLLFAYSRVSYLNLLKQIIFLAILTWSETSEDRFSHVEANMILISCSTSKLENIDICGIEIHMNDSFIYKICFVLQYFCCNSQWKLSILSCQGFS